MPAASLMPALSTSTPIRRAGDLGPDAVAVALLGVTTEVMGNCGFGIVPSRQLLRDLIMRNLAVVRGMEIDALRAGSTGSSSFGEYLAAVRRGGRCEPRGASSGIRAVRTAVMGDEGSVRREQPPPSWPR